MQLFSFPPDLHISFAGHARVAQTRHQISGSPSCMHGLRILFAADLHVGMKTNVDGLVSEMNALKPDLILLGGDYADTYDCMQRFLSAAKALRAPHGIYAVLGNNDHEAMPRRSEIKAAMKASGIALLVNQMRRVPLLGGDLFLNGVDEHKHGHPVLKSPYANAQANDYRILLSHYPILPAFSTDSRPDLMLSGHTHGGQFNLLGITPYTIGFESIGEKNLAPALVCGEKRFGATTLIVSKGIGASRIPLRIGVRPEIHLIEFC